MAWIQVRDKVYEDPVQGVHDHSVLQTHHPPITTHAYLPHDGDSLANETERYVEIKDNNKMYSYLIRYFFQFWL